MSLRSVWFIVFMFYMPLISLNNGLFIIEKGVLKSSTIIVNLPIFLSILASGISELCC